MSKAEYENAVVAVNAEIIELLAKRNDLAKQIAILDQRLAQLKATHETLTTLLGAAKITLVQPEQRLEEYVGDVGISDAIRQAFATATITMSPSEVKAALLLRGVDLSGYVNASAVIYNTLLRLEKQGEIFRVNNGWIANPLGSSGRSGQIVKVTDK